MKLVCLIGRLRRPWCVWTCSILWPQEDMRLPGGSFSFFLIRSHWSWFQTLGIPGYNKDASSCVFCWRNWTITCLKKCQWTAWWFVDPSQTFSIHVSLVHRRSPKLCPIWLVFGGVRNLAAAITCRWSICDVSNLGRWKSMFADPQRKGPASLLPSTSCACTFRLETHSCLVCLEVRSRPQNPTDSTSFSLSWYIDGWNLLLAKQFRGQYDRVSICQSKGLHFGQGIQRHRQGGCRHPVQSEPGLFGLLHRRGPPAPGSGGTTSTWSRVCFWCCPRPGCESYLENNMFVDSC